MTLKGFDVSFNQPGNVDFALAKSEGYDFCIVRISHADHDGNVFEDDWFRTNINAAIAAGLKVGVYHFFNATNPETARQEARAFINLYKSLVTPGVTDEVGVWLDMEAAPGYVLDRVPPDVLTASVFAFVLECNKAGIDIGIYGNYSWLTKKLDVSQFASYVKFWLSEPDNRPYWKDEHPEKKVKIWQHSFEGTVGGVYPVDLDVMYDD